MTNNMETATVKIKKTISHYGFFCNDRAYGEHDPEYRKWIEKDGIKWDDYNSGDCATDGEMLDDFCTENNKLFEFIFCEEADGFYKVNKGLQLWLKYF